MSMYADLEASASRRGDRKQQPRPGYGALRTHSARTGQLKQWRQTRAHPYGGSPALRSRGTGGGSRVVVVSAPQQQQQQQAVDRKQPGVRVTGLDFNWGVPDLQEIFSSQGFPPQTVRLFTRPDGASRGIAILNYSNANAAAKVAQEMDGAQVDGRYINVRLLDTKTGSRTVQQRVDAPLTVVRRGSARGAAAGGRGGGRGQQQQRQKQGQGKPQNQQSQGQGRRGGRGGGRGRGRRSGPLTPEQLAEQRTSLDQQLESYRTA